MHLLTKPTGSGIRREDGPFILRVDAQLVTHLVALFIGQQHGMVERVAGNGQTPPLDGIGKDDGRLPTGLRRFVQNGEQFDQVMTTQVGDHRRQILIGHILQDGAQFWCGTFQPLPQVGAGQPNQCLVLFVVHVIDALAQQIAIGQGKECL